MDLLKDTARFMEIGGQLAPEKSGENTDQELRLRLLDEEVREYKIGVDEEDLVEEVDGLVDILVIAAGSLVSRVGVQCAQALLDEVLASNLSKFERDENGAWQPILREDGKILKGKFYFEPQIRQILMSYGVMENSNG